MQAPAMRLSRLMLLLALLPAAVAFAETPQEKQAREDLERQLKAMVGTPPTKIRVEFVGLDQPNYELIEASFRLDGRNLPVSDLKKLNSDGEHLIFHGDVEPGPHRLESKFEFRNTTSQVVSAEGGYKWKPGSEVSFKSESGIEVRILVTPDLNMSAELKNRITVKSPATVKMLAKLDDGTMPDPLAKPKIVAVADVPDAGAPAAVAAADPAAEKAAAKKVAADEKKRLAEEAKAAKLAAAEAKKQAAADAKAAKLAAADEKKRASDDARAAKLAAADEKKRAAAEDKKRAEDQKLAAATPKAAAVTNDTAAPVEPVAAAPAAEVDAGAVAVAEVDAGPAVVAVAAPPVKVAVAEPVPEASGMSPLVIGIGVAVVALLLFLVLRRKKPNEGS
jgi:hypothetical protein